MFSYKLTMPRIDDGLGWVRCRLQLVGMSLGWVKMTHTQLWASSVVSLGYLMKLKSDLDEYSGSIDSLYGSRKN